MRPEIEQKIIENQNPLKVDLVSMKVCDNEILEIIQKIKVDKPMVNVIDLDNNNISDKGAIDLGDALVHFKEIKELSLQYNKIGRTGAIKLFSLKKIFSDLEILFHGNKITNTGKMGEIERLALTDPIDPIGP